MPKPKLTSGALIRLSGYAFPGNARELRNVLERAVIESGGDFIREEDLHLADTPAGQPSAMGDEALIQHVLAGDLGYSDAVNRFQQYLVEQALDACDGNRHETARRLQMHRPNLLRLMKRLELSDR